MECPNCSTRINNSSRRCGRCGTTVPPGQYLLEESGVVERTVPTAAAEERPFESTSRSARLGDRLIAAVLDGAVMSGAFALISAWSLRKWSFFNGEVLHVTAASIVLAVMLSTATLYVYLWLFEACFGATLGKIMVGIRIARTAAHNCIAASAIRNAFRIVDGIGFYIVGGLFAGFSRMRQRLGDIVAGTIVVESTFAPAAKAMAVVLWMAALMGAGWGLRGIGSAEFRSQPPKYFGGSVVQLGYTVESAYMCVSGMRVDLRHDPATPGNGVAAVSSSLR